MNTNVELRNNSCFCFCNSIVYQKIDTKKIQRRFSAGSTFFETFREGKLLFITYYLLRNTVFLEDNF